LSKHPIIRQLHAAVLLLLLVFSITPRQSLHDWLANHKDGVGHCSYADVIHFSKDGFHCNCDSLVAESPFTHQSLEFDFSTLRVFASRQLFALHPFHAETHFFFSLRGPPADLS
jgi:hypothetical protein